jgi:hypothetical protein
MTRLATALAALALAPLPAAAGELVILLQTQETTDFVAQCPGPADPTHPDYLNVRLAAYVYAPRTRAADGLVMKDLGLPIGLVHGCGKFTPAHLQRPSPGEPYPRAPFSMSFELPTGNFFAEGECAAANVSFPMYPVLAPLALVGCSLDVRPDPAQGITRGIATSSSVFIPYPIPGYDTGSYWTLHLYTADVAAR